MRCTIRSWGANELSAFVVAAACFVWPADAHAECRDFGRMGVGISALVATLPAMAASTFGVPAIAVAIDEDLDYWPGVGWSALGAFLGGGSGTLGVLFECPYPETLYLPATLSLAGSILTTTIWAVSADDTDNKDGETPAEVGRLALTPLGANSLSGASLTLTGTF